MTKQYTALAEGIRLKLKTSKAQNNTSQGVGVLASEQTGVSASSLATLPYYGNAQKIP